MKPAAFAYARPDSLAQAIAQFRTGVAPAAGANGAAAANSAQAPGDAVGALPASNPDVRLIAGGQSLGPMLNLRLAEPALLVDIRRLPELRGHRVDGGRLFIGAAVTHAQIEDGHLPDTTRGMLTTVARNIAYRAIRNRGTIGGSLAHADPAADWVNALIALSATLHVQGRQGARPVDAHAFIRSAYQTALAPGEVLVAIELPAFSPRMRWGYYKICAKVGEFATAIGAVVVDPELGITRLLAGAIEARPLLLTGLESLIDSRYEDARDAIASHLAARLPDSDEVFIHQHAVALARAIGQMKQR
jgi:carbon-monoxide dehydrogenase medium subunit